MATAKVSINGTAIIDLTDTTTEAADAKAGTKFYDDAGVATTGAATARTSSDLTASGATVTVPAGIYSSSATKSVASGTAGTPTATKGTVSNHAVSVTPSVTNTSGYITGSTKTGTAVTVSASELVSGDLAITQNGNNIDVSTYSTVSVSVSGGGGMNKQAYFGSATTTATAYTATTVSLTVAVTGTYKVSWTGWRNTTSGTSGSQLYRTRSGSTTAIGNANTTFQNSYGHRVELTGQQFNKDDVITVYARARSAQYVMGVANLVIEQTA